MYSFDEALEDPQRLKLFQVFCETQHCMEPLLFWQRVNIFKKDPSKEFAAFIWKTFLEPSGSSFFAMEQSVINNVVEALKVEDGLCVQGMAHSFLHRKFPMESAVLRTCSTSARCAPESTCRIFSFHCTRKNLWGSERERKSEILKAENKSSFVQLILLNSE